MTKQQDIHRVFMWVRQVYEEAQYLLEDSVGLFEQEGFSVKDVDAMQKVVYGTLLSAEQFPFVYLGCRLFFSESKEDSLAFVAVDYHSSFREGPAILAGAVKCLAGKKGVGAPALNVAARLRGFSGVFKPTSLDLAGPVTYQSTVQSKKRFPAVEEVRCFELPLTQIDTRERLLELVQAVCAMYEGDDQPARELIRKSQIA